MENKEEPVKIIGTIGDWKMFRDKLIIGLTRCTDEDTFLTLMTSLYISMGTPKEIAKIRDLLGRPRLSEEELDLIEELEERERLKEKMNKGGQK